MRKYSFLLAVVCYNNEYEVCSFIKQIEMQSNCNDIAIAITVNSSKNISIIEKVIQVSKVDCFLFNQNNNLGYLNGCLYGIRELAENIDYEWALVTNTDVSFVGNDFFTKIMNNKYDENIWGIAPSIQLPDKSFQNPYLITRPTLKELERLSYIFNNYYLFYGYSILSDIKKSVLGKIRKSDSIQDSKVIYAAHGSCMILRKNLVQYLLKEQISLFLYCEEEYIAGLIKEHKKLVYFDNQLNVLHNEHQTLGKIDYKKKQEWYRASMLCIRNRFY